MTTPSSPNPQYGQPADPKVEASYWLLLSAAIERAEVLAMVTPPMTRLQDVNSGARLDMQCQAYALAIPKATREMIQRKALELATLEPHPG